ncbi:MAG: hypothetical protein R3E31_02435 [Chloroflexota bacterium]
MAGWRLQDVSTIGRRFQNSGTVLDAGVPACSGQRRLGTMRTSIWSSCQLANPAALPCRIWLADGRSYSLAAITSCAARSPER